MRVVAPASFYGSGASRGTRKGHTTWEEASERAHVQYLRRVLEGERTAHAPARAGGAPEGQRGYDGPGQAVAVVAAFSKQGAAFRRADDMAEMAAVEGNVVGPASVPGGPMPRLWAEEYAERRDGSRRYLVATVPAFWDHYRRLAPDRRLHYELIREGDACHAYLDLEYARALGKGEADARDGPGMAATALAYVRRAFEARFPDEPWDESVDGGGATKVTVLDSSSSSKFSQHVVVRLAGGAVAFADNAHVGALVDEALALARGDRDAGRTGPGPLLPECLFWGGADGGAESCFVDTSVYSRNRCFRLFLSSKAGKGVPLTHVSAPGEGIALERDVFEASLACNVPRGARLLTCGAGRPVSGARGRVVMSSSSSSSASASLLPLSPLLGMAPPEGLASVEAFVRRIADSRACKPPGTTGIRSWTLFPDMAVVTFYLSGTRFCHRIDREHRSNGVFYTVDLASGAADQRCFDPDCKGYRHYIPLPLDVLGSHERSEYAAYARHGPAPRCDGREVTPPGTPMKAPPASSPRPSAPADNDANDDDDDDDDDDDAQWMEAALTAERIALARRSRSPPERILGEAERLDI